MAQAQDTRALAREYFTKIFEIVLEGFGGEIDEVTARAKLQIVEARALANADNIGGTEKVFDATLIMREAASEVFGYDLTRPATQEQH